MEVPVQQLGCEQDGHREAVREGSRNKKRRWGSAGPDLGNTGHRSRGLQLMPVAAGRHGRWLNREVVQTWLVCRKNNLPAMMDGLRPAGAGLVCGLVAVCRLLVAVTSFVAEHTL